MNIKKTLVLFIAVFTVTGCITEFNASLPPDETSVLLVEGNIIENTDVIFYLSRNFSMDSLTVPEESLDVRANLFIIDSNGNKSQPASYIGRGAYQIAIGMLDDHVEYGIQIEYEGDIYQTTLSKPLYTPEIDSVSWTQPERLGPVSIHVSTHNDTGGGDFFLWNYEEDWEITVRYPTSVFFNTNFESLYEIWPAPYQYCWKNFSGNRYLLGSMDALSQKRIVNRELYRIEATDDRFDFLYSVNVTQKAISRGAFEYYQSFVKLNEEMGGLFTPQPTEIVGNITCVTNPEKKVTGYVESLKNISQKRLYIASYDILRPYIQEDCGTIPEEILAIQYFSLIELYHRGYRPATYIDSPNYCWAYAKCTDCREKGGSKHKPDFWPNDHN